MTHTLHRQGDRPGLSEDFVVFAISAQGINSKGSAAQFAEFSRLVQQHNPVNIGDMRTGNKFAVDLETIAASTQDNSIFHAVFTDPSDVAAVLSDLARADLGLSIVVSGLFDQIGKCCRDAGLDEHTVEYSLGVWGRTDRLPHPAVQEIATMCGHGMVSFHLIDHCAKEIQQRKMPSEEAARVLARQCHCGIFNPVRAAQILEAYAEQQ